MSSYDTCFLIMFSSKQRTEADTAGGGTFIFLSAFCQEMLNQFFIYIFTFHFKAQTSEVWSFSVLD